MFTSQGILKSRYQLVFQRVLSIKAYDDIPGPRAYPIIGNLLDTKSCGKASLFSS